MFKGELYIQNVSVDTDLFGSTFGLPGEHWWEYYWKCRVAYTNDDKLEIGTASADFYFIQYRPRISLTKA